MLPLRETEKKKKSVERKGSINMPQKQKIRVEEKVRIVQKYLRREVGLREAAREVGVNHETIKKWASRYENEGIEGFLHSSTMKRWPMSKPSSVRKNWQASTKTSKRS